MLSVMFFSLPVLEGGPHVTTAALFKIVHLGKRAVGLRLKGLLVILLVVKHSSKMCQGHSEGQRLCHVSCQLKNSLV